MDYQGVLVSMQDVTELQLHSSWLGRMGAGGQQYLKGLNRYLILDLGCAEPLHLIALIVVLVSSIFHVKVSCQDQKNCENSL